MSYDAYMKSRLPLLTGEDVPETYRRLGFKQWRPSSTQDPDYIKYLSRTKSLQTGTAGYENYMKTRQQAGATTGYEQYMQSRKLTTEQDFRLLSSLSKPLTSATGVLPSAQETPTVDRRIRLLEQAGRLPLAERIPFSPVGMLKAGGILQATERLKENKYAERFARPKEQWTMHETYFASPENFRQADIKTVEDYLRKANEEAERGMTFPAKVLTGASYLPAWMTEFLVTGGLAQLGTQATKQTAIKLLGSSAKTTAGKAAIRAAGLAGSAALRTTAMTHRIGESTLQRRIQSYLTQEPESWATSIAKGYGDVFIETLSEQTGGEITKGLSAVVNKLPFGGKFINALKGAWMKISPDNTAKAFTEKIFTRAGYHGIVGEIGEERVATILHGIAGTQDFGKGKDANVIDRLVAGLQEDAKNFTVEAAVLSLPAGAKYATTRAISKLQAPAQEKAAGVTEGKVEAGTLQGIQQKIKKQLEEVRAAINRIAPNVKIRLAHPNAKAAIRMDESGEYIEVKPALLEKIREQYPGKETAMLEGLVEEELIHQQQIRELGGREKAREAFEKAWKDASPELRQAAKEAMGGISRDNAQMGAELLRMQEQLRRRGDIVESLVSERQEAVKRVKELLAPPPAVAEKKPAFTMTFAEYKKAHPEKGILAIVDHLALTRQAIVEGREISAEVLKDHPELAKGLEQHKAIQKIRAELKAKETTPPAGVKKKAFGKQVEDLKKLHRAGKITTAELGKRISAIKTEPAEPTKEIKAVGLQKLVDDFESGKIETIEDLADEIEAVVENKKVLVAVDNYKRAVEEDRFEHGMRSGLPEEAGDKLLAVLKEQAEAKPKLVDLGPAKETELEKLQRGLSRVVRDKGKGWQLKAQVYRAEIRKLQRKAKEVPKQEVGVKFPDGKEMFYAPEQLAKTTAPETIPAEKPWLGEPQTAKDLAMHAVRTGAGVEMLERGATEDEVIKYLKKAQPGIGSKEWGNASIGGYIEGKKISTNYIIVEKDGKYERFKLKDIVAEIKRQLPEIEPQTAERLEEIDQQKPQPKAVSKLRQYPSGKSTVIEKQTGSDAAVYKVVELDDIIASHEAIRFAPRKDYPEGVQERLYQTDKTEQLKVIEQQQDFKPEFLLSDNPDAVNGPPIVSGEGIILAGNSRAMTLERVFKLDAKAAARYKKMLAEKAELFGVDPKDINKLKQPVLVREMADVPADVDDVRRLAREYNQPLTHTLSSASDAVSRAKNLSNDSMNMIGTMLAADEATTIKELLKGVRNTSRIIESLQADGVIGPREVNKYLDPRTQLLNEQGKELIERVLLGKVIDNPEILANIPHAVQRKIERALPHLAKVKAKGGEWDITDSLQTALDGYAYWDRQTQTLNDFLDFQQDLFGESPIKKDPKAQAIIRLLESKNSVEIKNTFGKYAQAATRDIAGQKRLFGEEVSPEKAFTETIGAIPKKKAKPLFEKKQKGFVHFPQTVRDIIHLAHSGLLPVQTRWRQLGITGKKFVARAIKADEKAQMHGSQTNEVMHDAIKKLTKEEKESFGKAVNYLAWEKTPKAERTRRGYRLRAKPISENQRKAAQEFLRNADYAMADYAGLGGVRRFAGGKAEPIKGGGIPWPQRFTKEGLQLYSEAMGAIDSQGRPKLDALKKNALVKAMVEEGIVETEGEAWKKLKQFQENRRRPLYGYFETVKTPLPAKYLTFNCDDVLGQRFWKKMYLVIELARQFGIEHNRAYEYLRQIALEHGSKVSNEVASWFDNITGGARRKLTETQMISGRLAYKIGDYQVLKLSPLTSAQNYSQRFLSMMEWGPKALPALFTKTTKEARLEARLSGAIPFDPFTSGVAADLRTGEGRAFARLWIEMIGMGITERGNNYTAATAAMSNVVRDLDELTKNRGRLGQMAKNILSLGGESPGAIKRRLREHGINYKAALARGHLTPDELHIAALREAKSKHFRADLFTTPLWWQNSPWGRQWAKYKIPFAYNMMTKCWKLAATELAHGNVRPALAFLAVTMITGEIYHAVRSLLLGESRKDVTLAKRLWQDWKDGAAVALFSSFMFGKTIVEIGSNALGGVWGKTILNVGKAADKVIDAPEHADEHILQLVNREIPVIKYINQMTHRKEHISQVQRRKIRYEAEKEFTKTEGDRYYYYWDLYEALRDKKKDEAVKVIRSLGRLGADEDSTMAALESRRPSKTSYEKRPVMLTKVNKEQLRMIAEEEKQHDVIMARAHDLIKKDYNQWIARQIQTAESEKLPAGQRERAKTRLRNLGIKKTQYRTYLRKAKKEKRASARRRK